MTIAEIAAHLANTWGDKTLAEFRDEADREANGTVFESIRIAGGPRLVLIVCITDMDQIALVDGALGLVGDGMCEDWSTLTLGDLFKRTSLGAGFSFEALRDEFGRRSALILSSTEPRSMQSMGALFELPE